VQADFAIQAKPIFRNATARENTPTIPANHFPHHLILLTTVFFEIPESFSKKKPLGWQRALTRAAERDSRNSVYKQFRDTTLPVNFLLEKENSIHRHNTGSVVLRGIVIIVIAGKPSLFLERIFRESFLKVLKRIFLKVFLERVRILLLWC